jgi:hypothetical protein
MYEEQNLKIDFSFTDEFGQECRVVKNLTTAVLIDGNYFELLVNEFKLFLLGSGFSQNIVNKLQIVD